MKCPYKKITKIKAGVYPCLKLIEIDFDECEECNCAAAIFYYDGTGVYKIFSGCHLLQKGADNE